MLNINTILNEDDRKAIEAAIHDIESRSDAEVRILVLTRDRGRMKKMDMRALAEAKFHELGMTATRHHNGLLLLIHLQRRQFTLIGDTGLHDRIPDGNWEPYAEKLSSYFREERFREGVVTILQEIGLILAEHFPVSPDDTNELPDTIAVE